MFTFSGRWFQSNTKKYKETLSLVNRAMWKQTQQPNIYMRIIQCCFKRRSPFFS